jgi:signal transduction histidine kinase
MLAKRLMLIVFGLTAGLIAAVELVLIVEGPVTPWAYALAPLVGLVYFLAGVVAWPRRPANRTCVLLTLAGVAWFASALSSVGTPALIAVGEIVAIVPVAIVIHVLFTFPSGVVQTRLERVGVVLGYVAALVLQAPDYLFGENDPPYGVLRIAERPGLASVGNIAQVLTALGVSVLIVVSLRWRLRDAAPSQRRALVPFVAYGVAALTVIPLVSNLLPLVFGVGDGVTVAVQLVALAGIPFAALVTMLRGGFARIGAIEQLSVWLGDARRADVRDALARALGDRSLELGFCLDDGTLVDGAGRPFRPPRRAGGHGLHDVIVEGRPVAVISYDPTLIGEHAELEAAERVLAVWIERERLIAALRASDAALRRSRLRVIEAADRERRRIARDLHDGLASRLLLLALRTDAMRGEVASVSPDAGRDLAALRDELQASISELRTLVQGMMPAGLIERGLPAALEDLADRMLLPTRLECHGASGLTPEIESAAYFVVAEALANATRHADAQNLTVRIVGEGDRLTIEIADDGVGGAQRSIGSGLRGMADRVEAYGGQLATDTLPAGGSVIRATLPRLPAVEHGRRDAHDEPAEPALIAAARRGSPSTTEGRL